MSQLFCGNTCESTKSVFNEFQFLLQITRDFCLLRRSTDSCVAGIQGVLATYQSCIQSVELWGPTNFAPVIYHVAQFGLDAAKEGATKVRPHQEVLSCYFLIEG